MPRAPLARDQSRRPPLTMCTNDQEFLCSEGEDVLLSDERTEKSLFIRHDSGSVVSF